MSTYQKQEKYNLGNKSLRTFVLILSLLGTTSSYAGGQLRGNDSRDEGFSGLATRLQHTTQYVAEDREADFRRVAKQYHNEGAWGAISAAVQVGIERVSRGARKRLVITNENSMQMEAFLENQDTGKVRKLGVILSGERKEFPLERSEEDDSCRVRGVLANFFKLSAESDLLTFDEDRQLVFRKDLVGTTAVVEK